MFRDVKLYRWLTLSPRQGGTSVFESFAGVWSKKRRDCFDALLVCRHTIQLLCQRWICSNTPGMLHYPPPDPGGFDGEHSESCQQVQHFKLHPHNLFCSLPHWKGHQSKQKDDLHCDVPVLQEGYWPLFSCCKQQRNDIISFIWEYITSYICYNIKCGMAVIYLLIFLWK